MKRTLKILLIVLLVLALLAAGLIWYMVARMRRGAVDTVEQPDGMSVIEGNRDETLTILDSPRPDDGEDEEDDEDDEDVAYEEQPIYQVDPKDPNVVNILFIGTDSRSGNIEATGRSDSMMLASYNRETHVVKLISLMRDSWVKVNGKYWGRLNTAYNSGGPGGLINTLNINFGLDVQYYAAISFTAFEELIDSIGGVTVDLTKHEASYINTKMGKRVLEVKDGPVLLDGEKALWYARCRADSDGDFSRTERQRHLLELIFNDMRQDGNVGKVMGLATYAVENVTTNLTLDMMVQLGTSVLSGETTIESHRMPYDDTWSYADKNGASVLSIDLEENARLLAETIYGK